jgi:hypothetical protein
MENVENQTAVYPRFPPPLGNRPRRDFHIPTAPATVPFSRKPKNQKVAARAFRALTAVPKKEEAAAAEGGHDHPAFRLKPGLEKLFEKRACQNRVRRGINHLFCVGFLWPVLK